MKKVAPFFILGNPRSGTSLFRIILDSHSKITVPPECGYIEWFFEKYKDWDDSTSNSRMMEFVEDIVAAKKFETWGIPKLRLFNHINKTKPGDYQSLCQSVVEVYAILNGSNFDIWGDKNNYYIHKLDKIKTIYPSASYIHIVRDGRDVATSYKGVHGINKTFKYKPDLPESIEDIAKEWHSNISTIGSFIDNGNNVLEIKYEDLLLDTKNIVTKALEFLGFEFEANMLNYFERNKNQSVEPKELLAWKAKTLQKPDPSNIGKFKRILSVEDIQLFEQIATESLTKYNYLS